MKYTLDRIENGVAVLEGEDGTMYEFPGERLPADTAEGDTLICGADGAFTRDEALTIQRGERINSLFNKLKNKQERK